MANIGKTVKILILIQLVFINPIKSNKEESILTQILNKSDLQQNDNKNDEINLEPKAEDILNDDFLVLSNNLNNMKKNMIKTLEEKKEKEKLFMMNLEKKERGLITNDEEFFNMPKTCKKYFNLNSQKNLKTIFLTFKTELKDPKFEKSKYIYLFKNQKVKNFLQTKFRELAKSDSKIVEILNKDENEIIKEKEIIEEEPFYKFNTLPPLIENKVDYFYQEETLFEILPVYIDYY